MDISLLEKHIATLDKEIKKLILDIAEIECSDLKLSTAEECTKLLNDKLGRSKRLRKDLKRDLEIAKEMETGYLSKVDAEELKRLAPLLGRKVTVSYLKGIESMNLLGLQYKKSNDPNYGTDCWIAIVECTYKGNYKREHEVYKLSCIKPV